MTSPHEALVERVAKAMWSAEFEEVTYPWAQRSPEEKFSYLIMAHAVLAEVLRTLETVTEGMLQAMIEALPEDHPMLASERWLAMLHASPLTPPTKAPQE